MSFNPEPAARCVVVGGGPAGMMLSLLLARAGVPVSLLEAQRDFERDFRGDMIHPSTLEVLDQLGLAEPLHRLPHTTMRELQFVSAGGVHCMADFRRLPTRFPYVMVMPQARFLEFLAGEAERYPAFRLVRGAAVRRLLQHDGIVRGVACEGPQFAGEVEALQTVGADGRFSKVRRLAGVAATSQGQPMEVIWFRLPRLPDDPADRALLYFAPGRVVVLLGREHDWQIGCVVEPGRFTSMKSAGLEALHASVAGAVDWLAGRMRELGDWRAVNVLRIEADRVVEWHRPGLLLLGDAAHAMLPVGGIGLNCAVADAVEAANVLARPLLQGSVRPQHLVDVQRRREGMTASAQRFQLVQHRALRRALVATGPVTLPWPLRVLLRVPGLRDVPARIMAFGVRRVRVCTPVAHGAPGHPAPTVNPDV
ncbi:MAG: FAD-dependent oxidoreductase [Acidobacteriota bacterium]|nr:FAD-dependent oxidoreductase [Acidobacteriota bacterium]